MYAHKKSFLTLVLLEFNSSNNHFLVLDISFSVHSRLKTATKFYREIHGKFRRAAGKLQLTAINNSPEVSLLHCTLPISQQFAE